MRYHARDMAVVRAQRRRHPDRARVGDAVGGNRSERAARPLQEALHLPERFGGQHLPSIEAIDLEREGPPRGRFIAPRLAEAVKTAIERGEQALLFLNRRGFAPLTLCRRCGHRLACPNCDAWLVDHRFRRRLVCHHCGFAMPLPDKCPKCEATESLRAGRSRRRAAGSRRRRSCFPEARILVLSSDLVESMERLREELDDVAEGRFDIVIGTQLVAKGHHFPKLNLVGIVDADLGLANGDPRAAERTFQLLHQVVGRAGREEGQGIGFLQTHQPEHPVMKALIASATARRSTPPRSSCARRRTIRRSAGSRACWYPAPTSTRPKAMRARIAAAAPHDEAVRVLGPAEAPLAVVRGRYRFRILVKAPRNYDLSAYLREWMAKAPKKKGNIKLEVDVDPQSFL